MISEQLGFVEAMEHLYGGEVLWCVPKGYRDWWIALDNGTLYECDRAVGGYGWTRCKKGVSTMLGAEFWLKPGAPEFERAAYESESFLAAERNANPIFEAFQAGLRRGERDMLGGIDVLAEFQELRKEMRDEFRNIYIELSKLEGIK